MIVTVWNPLWRWGCSRRSDAGDRCGTLEAHRGMRRPGVEGWELEPRSVHHVDDFDHSRALLRRRRGTDATRCGLYPSGDSRSPEAQGADSRALSLRARRDGRARDARTPGSGPGMGSRADARFRRRRGLSACRSAGLRASGRGRGSGLSRQRRRSRDRDQRPARVHGRDAGSSHARLGGRGSVRVAVLGDPGAGDRGTRRMARRPLVDQLPALLGRGDQSARYTRPGSRRAVPVPRRRPPRAAAGHRRARRARRGRGDRLHRRPLPSRDRIRRSAGARTGSRRRRARARPSDDRGRDRATRSRRLRRLRRALPRGQERRARCRGRLSLPPR